MNMYLHEIKSYRKSTITWTCSMVCLAIFFLSMFPAFSKDAEDFMKLIQAYPEEVRKAFGIGSNITSFFGFYSYVFFYIVLCGAIQAMNLGISIISKEVRQKTADFLLTKPVTRKQIVTSKLLAVLTSLIATNIIFIICAGIMSSIVKTQEFSMKIFILISITMFFVQLIFMTMGVFISLILPKIRSVIGVSLGVVFSFFIISMFGSIIGDKAVRYITPFKYFDTTYIIKNSGYETQFVVIGIVFVAVATIASYIIYMKKDIHAV
ncbi:MAG: transporter permease [Clostridiales bacterium]|nr:transporter permease [Clostridiales bacterium]